MGNEAKFDTRANDLLRRLKEKKESMQARHEGELAEINREIEAVSITMRLLHEFPSDSPEIMALEKPTIVPNNLTGKTARAACVEIAQKNHGTLRVSDAKKALLSAGILKANKNTWGSLYTTLLRSKEFRKSTEKGVFLLINSPREEAQTRLLQ